MHVKNPWNEQRIFAQRMLAAVVVVLALSIILVGRLVYLQLIRHAYYVAQSEYNRVRLDPIPASRGLILDRNGQVLADNEPTFQLELIREHVPDLDGTLARLATLGLIDRDDIDETRRIIFSRRTFDAVPIRLSMNEKEIGTFAVHRFEFPGVDLATRQTRHYPEGALAVHALGYVSAITDQDLQHIDRASYAGTTLIGKLGVESSYEHDLHGRNGFRELLVNALGRSVDNPGALSSDLRQQSPVPGRNLMLGIDLAVQKAAETALGDRRGAVVAIDPRNGDILALASKPGFDPALFSHRLSQHDYQALSEDIDRPLFNRALRGTYPSGSTIKPVIALAGLSNNLLDPDKREFCNGLFYLPGSRFAFREGKTGRHGAVDLRHAIARSCDVYFYGLAVRIGVTRLAAFMAPFGYGSLTGIDIGGEKPGILPSPEWKRKTFKRPQDQVWFPGETVNLGVGQGSLLVTPLQLAHMVSIIANRGRSFQPRLVVGWRDANGNTRPMPPVEETPITGVSDANWDVVIAGMEGATRCTDYCGTAAGAFVGVPYLAAGKTGTAQVFTVARNKTLTAKEPERLRDHAWFVAFAPADAPRIAVAVLVENGGFGASAAAPVARKVMDAWLLPAAAAATPEAAAIPGAATESAPTPAAPATAAEPEQNHANR